MRLPVCATCGVQQGTAEPPAICPICADERQFVPEGGQIWTDAETLGATHRIVWAPEAEGVWSLRADPPFAIGQRAFLIERPAGGALLWDCLSVLDAPTRARIAERSGLSAIAISHPHYYSAIIDWSEAFDAPVHIHADDAGWLQRRGPSIRLWEGEIAPLGEGATLIRCGGHFPGAAALHCDWLADGQGALFAGDTLQVCADRRHVSFMYSYPNLIPVDAAAVRRIEAAVAPFGFETIYGAFEGRTIRTGGSRAVAASADRYLRAIAADAGA